jgi:hypothetical protein
MKSRSWFAAIAACSLILGCGTVYTYDGQRYNSREEMLAAADRALAGAVATVEPLPKPLTDKTLVFAIPSEVAAMKISVANFERRMGRPIGLGEQVTLGGITTANMKSIKVYYEAIKRRNIYSSVKFLELDSGSADLQAAPSEDVFYYSEPRQESGQFFYVSAKSGKQAFAYDKGGATISQRVNSLVSAIQVYAVRD